MEPVQAGACTSLMLSKIGIQHIIIDKETFPRDKTCGDGLILYVFKALKSIDNQLLEEFLRHPAFLHSYNGKFHVSDKLSINIEEGRDKTHAPIFYGKRIDFDNFLTEKIPSPFATAEFGNPVIELNEKEDEIVTILKDGKEISSKIVIGADGIQSIVSKKLGQNKIDQKRTSTFVSAYFKGLSNLSPNNGAEIRLIYENTPLFFYIFPLPNGEANVSLGGLSSEVKSNKINLKRTIADLIKSHSQIASKFDNAEQVSDWRGWGVPCNFGHLNVLGNRFMLVGDAAGLANAFYKEGVGTGMMSGVIAAQKIKACLDQNNFSKAFLANYEDQLEHEFGRLLRYSKKALRMTPHRYLFKALILFSKKLIEKKIKSIIETRTYNHVSTYTTN